MPSSMAGELLHKLDNAVQVVGARQPEHSKQSSYLGGSQEDSANCLRACFCHQQMCSAKSAACARERLGECIF